LGAFFEDFIAPPPPPPQPPPPPLPPRGGARGRVLGRCEDERAPRRPVLRQFAPHREVR